MSTHRMYYVFAQFYMHFLLHTHTHTKCQCMRYIYIYMHICISIDKSIFACSC